ncbi:ProP effector [Bisgaardia hudsonensis]|uniref:RNA chaperone ProQ n=1 Tax=Bisgaardia hudsonensis TaxID=109472 RepID=A0A4R2N0V8_9PAST|nr:RNA chaperone ProQ [Bisgaardia hudsonensis]QLB13286.1 RNA chaperone ProQ [Bisgaardia hudsonensis]TCP13133.1 ProP effector [Bisgaardia hudsonensis]
MSEVKKLKNNKEIIEYLAGKFPLCFILEGEAKPLKIGLFKDLVEVLSDDESISNTQLRQALRQYTSNWRYLYGCREGAERVDLYGNSCGILEKEHVEHALQKLNEAKAKFAEKKATGKFSKKKTNKNNLDSNDVAKKTNLRKNIVKTQFKPINIDELKVQSKVKVKIANKLNIATVLDISKDNVRVELDNGLVISVTADRLFKINKN